MSFVIEDTIDIDRPIEEVWAHLESNDEWREPFILDVEPLDQREPEVGARYRDDWEMMGLSGYSVNEITEVEAPRALRWRQVEESGGPTRVVEGEYLLEELPGGRTRFTLRNEYEGRHLWKVLTPLMRPKVEKDVYPQMLQQLKATLEGGGAGDQVEP